MPATAKRQQRCRRCGCHCTCVNVALQIISLQSRPSNTSAAVPVCNGGLLTTADHGRRCSVGLAACCRSVAAPPPLPLLRIVPLSPAHLYIKYAEQRPPLQCCHAEEHCPLSGRRQQRRRGFCGAAAQLRATSAVLTVSYREIQFRHQAALAGLHTEELSSDEELKRSPASPAACG